MRGDVALAAIAILGAALYWRTQNDLAASVEDWENQGEGGATAGDDESNIFSDAVDSMTSVFTNWPKGSEPYQDQIQAAAALNGVPVEILAWLLWKESRYNPRIIDGSIRSRVGALGIAQFMPATAAQELGSVTNALNPTVAIPGAARYLARLYRSTGSWTAALAAYNWGIGNVTRKGLDAAPAETRDYYSVILAKSNYSEGMA
jgi:soluble lytic murein transglycosylase-like protein